MLIMNKLLLRVTIFSIAMGFLESAVVVYLRALYYPEGFVFPLKAMPNIIMLTELLREAATLIMLVYIGILSGQTFVQRFSYFLISFAVWDLTYYLFLKLLLNWPDSLFTWDILFLIPAPWVGPVLAPCIIFFCMILLGIYLLKTAQHRKQLKLLWYDWILLCCASILFIISFTREQLYEAAALGRSLLETSQHYIPHQYDWALFLLALLTLFGWWIHFHQRQLKVLRKNNDSSVYHP